MNKLMQAYTNKTLTTNGDLAFKSTLNSLVDFYYKAGSILEKQNKVTTFELLNKNFPQIIKLWNDAFEENPTCALRLLFELRDLRGTQTGRKTKNVVAIIYKYLATKYPEQFSKQFFNIVKYGCWKDLLWLMNTPVEPAMIRFWWEQIVEDYVNLAENNQITLAAKWFPSENAGKLNRVFFYKFAKVLNLRFKNIRRVVSKLRTKLNIVEQKMSSHQWTSIDYGSLPSRSNYIYRKVFESHDPIGYNKYLTAVKDGKEKLNISHVEMYEMFANIKTVEQVRFETLINEIKAWFPQGYNIVPVLDTSGSMEMWNWGHNQEVVSTKYRPFDIALGMAIACMKANNGMFKNTLFEFNSIAKLHYFKQENYAKLAKEIKTNVQVGGSTNVISIFEKILSIAEINKLADSDLPNVVLILSDMQFNASGNINQTAQTAYSKIKSIYRNKGYTLPQIVFWNINAKAGTVPVLMNEINTLLVSGHTQNVFKSIIMNAATPFELVMKIVNNERYSTVEW